MKRINNIVTDIERKDKINRTLFIAFVILIAGFMAYVLFAERRIQVKDNEITVLQIKNSDTYKELAETYSELATTHKHLAEEKEKTQRQYEELQKSLNPKDYWNSVQNENSVEEYISYITTKLNIDRTGYLDKAIDRLLSDDVGERDFQGWLHLGLKDREGNFTMKDDLVEIIYRKDEEDVVPNSEVKVGDIIQLKTSQNRITYKNKKLRSKNKLGWRNKTKAVVVETWKNPDNAEFRIKIKYY